MSNKVVCLRGFVNRVKFTENEDDAKKNRLNVSVSTSLLGIKKDEKCYINYEITLWGSQADKYSDVLVAAKKGSDEKSTMVSFVGELKKVDANYSESDDKIYVNHYVDVSPLDFNVLSGGNADAVVEKKSAPKSTPKKQSKLEDDDDI